MKGATGSMMDEEKDQAVGEWLRSDDPARQIAGHLAARIVAGLERRGRALPSDEALAAEFTAPVPAAADAKELLCKEGFARADDGDCLPNLNVDLMRRPSEDQILHWRASDDPAGPIMADLAARVLAGMIEPGDPLPPDDVLAEPDQKSAHRAKLRLSCFPGIVRMRSYREFRAGSARQA